MKYFQRGFNYSQDGPGNRLIYHLQGCDMRCPWCSNPEGLEMDYKKAVVKDDEEVISDIVRSRKMFFDDGGVTFTGGEATMQYDSLHKVLKAVQAEGITTCIETNATSPKLLQLASHIDFLIMDFKHYDNEKHQEVTGMSNEMIKANIRRIAEAGIRASIRTPLIHGFNDRPGDIEGFLDFYDTIDTANFSFELLPYHEYGKDKWKSLGLEYQVSDGYVTKETVAEYEQKYKANGLNVIHT